MSNCLCTLFKEHLLCVSYLASAVYFFQTHTYTHRYTNMHTHTHTRTRTHAYMHTHTCIHTQHIHTHTHTHTHTSQFRALGGPQVSSPRAIPNTLTSYVHPGGRTPHHLREVLPFLLPVWTPSGLGKGPELAEGVPHLPAEATVQAAARPLPEQVWREGAPGVPQLAF